MEIAACYPGKQLSTVGKWALSSYHQQQQSLLGLTAEAVTTAFHLWYFPVQQDIDLSTLSAVGERRQVMGEPPHCACAMVAALGKPPAGPTPPAFHLQEIPAEFVAPVFLLLQPDTRYPTEGSSLPLRRQQSLVNFSPCKRYQNPAGVPGPSRRDVHPTNAPRRYAEKWEGSGHGKKIWLVEVVPVSTCTRGAASA